MLEEVAVVSSGFRSIIQCARLLNLCVLAGMIMISRNARTAANQFVPLPFYSTDNISSASGISDDGRIIVGQSAGSQLHAVRWTNGVVDLPSGGTPPGAASDVSANGSVIVGGSDGIYRWTAATGWTNLGYLGTSGYGHGSDISADGSVIVGSTSLAGVTNGLRAARWTAAHGLEALGSINGTSNEATAISDDGSIIVGGSTNGGPSFMWTEATGIQPIPNVPLNFTSRALGISGDGKVIVGGDGFYGYRWRNGVVDRLGIGEGRVVSDDGNLVFGDNFGQQPWAWTPSGGLLTTNVFFANAGLQLPAGWSNPLVLDITPDASKVVGFATNASGKNQAFYATVPEPALLPAVFLIVQLCRVRTRPGGLRR
jgi:uncharacterized membrane protein